MQTREQLLLLLQLTSYDVRPTHNAARNGQGSRETNRRETDSYVQTEIQIGLLSHFARLQ